MLFPQGNWGVNNKVEMPSNREIYDGKNEQNCLRSLIFKHLTPAVQNS